MLDNIGQFLKILQDIQMLLTDLRRFEYNGQESKYWFENDGQYWQTSLAGSATLGDTS